MALDPRSFTAVSCQKTNQQRVNSVNSRQAFFSQLGKVGDLAVLNDIKGLNSVGKGLRLMSATSNAVRTGQNGALPTSIGTSIDAGANWVLNSMGIDSNTLGFLNNLNPAIANQAYGQAKNIYSDVKQGRFSLQKIPDILQDFQNLERLLRGVYTPGANKGALKQFCEASPYAIDLITTRSPKYKFLFVVEFVFNGEYSQALGYVNNTFAFTVQNSTRPALKYDMEKLNLYNFRTQVITKTEFDDMKMSFYDDQSNVGLKFYTAFMRSTVPISNILTPSEAEVAYDDGGMIFNRKSDLGATQVTNANILYPYSSSSYSPPVNDQGYYKNILREIKLFEVYNWGRNYNVYRFFNPRFTTFHFDDLDMTGGTAPTSFQVQFNYDGVGIVVAQDMSVDGGGNRDGSSPGSPTELTKTGLYPMEYVGLSRSPNLQQAGSGIKPNPLGNILGKGAAYPSPDWIPSSPQNPVPNLYGSAPSIGTTIFNPNAAGLSQLTAAPLAALNSAANNIQLAPSGSSIVGDQQGPPLPA